MKTILKYCLFYTLLAGCIAGITYVSYHKGNTDMAKYAANYSREQFYRGMFISCYVVFGKQDECSQGIRNAITNNWYETNDPVTRTP